MKSAQSHRICGFPCLCSLRPRVTASRALWHLLYPLTPLTLKRTRLPPGALLLLGLVDLEALHAVLLALGVQLRVLLLLGALLLRVRVAHDRHRAGVRRVAGLRAPSPVTRPTRCRQEKKCIKLRLTLFRRQKVSETVIVLPIAHETLLLV